MNLNQKNVKKIRGLILFTGIICLILMKFDLLMQAVFFVINILKPFILGGMIAFVINIPMRFFENKLFYPKKISEKGKRILEKIRRPVSLVIAMLAVLLVITLVILTVIPQIVATVKLLAMEIPIFLQNLQSQLTVVFASNPALLSELVSIEIPQIDWQETVKTVWDFLQNGMGSMLSSTFTVASSIASGTINFFIALVFSFYILVQKEKLGSQVKRTIQAYTKPQVYQWIMKVFDLLNRNFSHFITGQCTEAVILGTMFVVAMAIFGFPYAIMVGVLIAFTALIPIVGAFIGCFIGAFLILVDDPAKAIWFLVLFIILQQIEGNFIYPHVVGNSVGLPSIWVLAAVTIGGSLMGIAGMLIFIPLLSTVYMLLRDDVNKRTEVKPKQIREETKNEAL